MKIQAELGNEKHDLEVRREDEKVYALVDGREYELEVAEPEPGVFLMKNGSQVTEAFVSAPSNTGGPLQVQMGGTTFEIRLIDPKRLRGSGGAADAGEGAAEIRTAMPGKVVRLLQNAGDEVQKGDGVVIVEAMKMQNELKAPKAGIVKEIRVKEGATVAGGDVLAIIE